MMGMPKRRSKRLQSSFCSLVTLTVRLLYFAMSSSEAPLCSTSSFSGMCSHLMMVHGLLSHAKSSPGNCHVLPGVRLRCLTHVLLTSAACGGRRS